jgi:hypothetical protein
MNEKFQKKVLNLKVKEYPKGKWRSRWEQEVRKDITQRVERTWEETEEIMGGQIGGKSCLLDVTLKVENVLRRDSTHSYNRKFVLSSFECQDHC